MLIDHFKNYEELLYQQGRIPDISSHPVNKGTPRESFIKLFLQDHLPSRLSIGSGELIDANSKKEDPRHQHDIVLFRNNYPKIKLDDNINVFLIESVVATIEVKSKLDYKGLNQAVEAAMSAKELNSSIVRSFYSGYLPPKVLNYVVAYEGPVKMMTVNTWIKKSYSEHGIQEDDLAVDDQQRRETSSKAIDGVFVLKKGFVYFDNVPFGFVNGQRGDHPNMKWVVGDVEYGSLQTLFLFLLGAMSNIDGSFLNPLPYFSKH